MCKAFITLGEKSIGHHQLLMTLLLHIQMTLENARISSYEYIQASNINSMYISWIEVSHETTSSYW